MTKKNRVFLFLTFISFIASCTPKEKDSKKVLKILTYSSFQSPFGPAPAIFKNFEKQCNCTVKAINAGDALMIKQKLKFQRGSIDLILGLDQFLIFDLNPEKFFQKIATKVKIDSAIPKLEAQQAPYYIPFDWAPLTILKKTGVKDYPKSIKEFSMEKFSKSLLISDAAFSSPGKHFLYWMAQLNGKFSFENLKAIKPSIYKIAPSWTSAYGLFQKGRGEFIFSYVTSPMYHKLVEKKDFVTPMYFKDVSKYPVQVEYVALNKDSKNVKLANEFIAHLLGDESQNILMKKNFMFSVKKEIIEKSEFNEIYKSVKKIKSLNYQLYRTNETKMKNLWSKFKK